MFVDFNDDRHPPGPWEPEPARGDLTQRQGRIIGWIIGLNLVMLLVAPLGGSSLIEALIALLRG